MASKKEETTEMLTVEAPRFETIELPIVGISPLVMHKFSLKTRQQIREQQEAGGPSKSRKNKEAKDFDALYEEAKYISDEGWLGIPAAAFRNAMVNVCRATNLVMTKAKRAFFIEADGFDKEDRTPLVKITVGEPYPHEAYVRLQNSTVDIRVRPMFDVGWEASPKIRYTQSLFTRQDVVNLMAHAGELEGILEGRPGSPKSCGQGWGQFRLKENKDG